MRGFGVAFYFTGCIHAVESYRFSYSALEQTEHIHKTGHLEPLPNK